MSESPSGPTPPERPSVFASLDHRQYLADWFAWKKEANPRFSHRAFARMAGQKSPSLALSVIAGRRNLTDETLDAFTTAMKLSADESEYFRLLWVLDMARTPEERNAAWQRLASTRHFREARPLEGESFRYLSTWYLPAIRELAACPGFKADPAWIARTLRPRIREREAAAALELLFDLGMLERTEDGSAQVCEASLATPPEVAGLAVHNFHREMLDRARDSIASMPQEERHLAGITVAVPSSLLPELKQQIHHFLQDMLQRCDAHADEAEQVLQLGVQLTPLSHAVSAQESS